MGPFNNVGGDLATDAGGGGEGGQEGVEEEIKGKTFYSEPCEKQNCKINKSYI